METLPRLLSAYPDKDWEAFIQLLFWYRRTPSGFMPGFCGIAVVYIVIAVYRTYLQQWLQIRWRRWLTTKFLDEWMSDRAYYRISLTAEHDSVGTDNPDQRISEDLRDFVDSTLSLGLSLLSNVFGHAEYMGDAVFSSSSLVAQFRFDAPSNSLQIDLNGDGVVDTTVKVMGVAALNQDDFTL